MTVRVHHIETQVPGSGVSQAILCDRMQSWVKPSHRRAVRHLYQHTGIDTRFSILDRFFLKKGPDDLFGVDREGALREPTTRERNERYVSEARTLSTDAARRALERCAEFAPAQITHLVVTTCTGFSNPGIDDHLVRRLRLSPSVQRDVLGFMGCSAALPALRLANHICLADSNAVVLVIAVEICSLHLHVDDRPDSLLANAIFADGAAVAVVSGRPPSTGRRTLRLDGFATRLIPETEHAMRWAIGDNGFEMTLSSEVPRMIGAHLRPIARSVLDDSSWSLSDIDGWAIHPGGRAILDRAEASLGLAPETLWASRSVLRRYGNMSSATSLFVLKEFLEAREGGNGRILALAFGPGLTVEAARLQREGA